MRVLSTFQSQSMIFQCSRRCTGLSKNLISANIMEISMLRHKSHNISASQNENLDIKNGHSTKSQEKNKDVNRTPQMKKYRNMISILKGRMSVLTTIIVLFACLTVMTEAVPPNDADEETSVDKIDFTEFTTETDHPNISTKTRRVKRDFTTFCLYMHTAKCNQFYSDLLTIGDRAKQIDKAPLKRHRLEKVNSSGRRAKLNSMIGQIKNWQGSRMMDLELCFECEKHLRSYKSSNPPSIRPDFYDIPIPVPENYDLNTLD